MEPYKRLFRSRRNRMISGVCGGVGEYFNIDPVIVRVLAVVLPVSLIGYIIAIIVIPENPEM